MAEAEILEVDVLIVGAGVAGLSCAIRLYDRLKRSRGGAGGTGGEGEPPSILVLEKGSRVGAHVLSGAVLDPRALDELIPDWRMRGAPVTQRVTSEEIALLSAEGLRRLPGALVPPYLHNEGNYIVSLGEVAAWLAEEAKRREIEILEGVAGAEVIFEGRRVRGVACGDTGLEKNGKPGPNHVPGARILAKTTVFAEGVHGSLAKQLIRRLKLDSDRRPQAYALGVKELWEIPAGTFPAGKVLHTLGYPLQSGPLALGTYHAFGGGFVYGLDETHAAVGLAAGLDYRDSRLDTHHEFQRFKEHPAIKAICSAGGAGKMVAYGAKTIPEGGYYAIPRCSGDGFVIAGDSAGFLNAARLKGIHLAMKSGMLAGETVAEALAKGDVSARQLGAYEDRFQTSWAREELYAVRNWRAAYAGGLVSGSIHELAQRFTGGRGFYDPLPSEPDYATMERLTPRRSRSAPKRIAPDGKLTFDKVTDVYHSGSVHGETQPCHLVVLDRELCEKRCTAEYGNPCQHFCPAGVYEWIGPLRNADCGLRIDAAKQTSGAGDSAPAAKSPEPGTGNEKPGTGNSATGHLQINSGNCVHCKTCDIKDPYQNILWAVPEGGDGPHYQRL